MLLEVNDLISGYQQLQVLNGITFNVEAGEIVCVLGANGAGKTTTLRTISGITRTWSGSVLFDGRALRTQTPEKRAAMGLGHVPEGRGIIQGLSVKDNFELGRALRRRASATEVTRDQEALLDIFKALRPKMHDRAASLSGGQQQMLALARALLAAPKLVMVDELSFGLAPTLVADLLRLIQDLRNSRGTTFLLVEQSGAVLEIADRAYVLTSGRIALVANARDVAGSDEFVRSYLG